MPLKNKWIVITRPSHQSENLKRKLESVGAKPVLFPLIEITPPADLGLIEKQLETLQDYDLVIFVSANAVTHSFEKISPSILQNVKVATTGKKTADALEQLGIKTDFCPKEFFNSEALLAIHEFSDYYAGKKIAIIRGEGGRNLLRDELQKKGASVDYINTYQRVFPQKDLDVLEQRAKQGELDVILLTSGTSVAKFFGLAQEVNWINQLTLMLGSPRMQKKIPGSFQGKLLVAEDPSDETLYKKLTEIF
ncbi:MAG: uroporphyrinogen-III synthase [Cocleimonas sp.]|nr:uroporphyrinogen-III synthase [Cocleimonas sp.]